MLTKGLDNVPGTSGNDTIIGSIDDNNAELNTMSTLDVVNGGAGVDTLKVAFNATKAAAIALPNLSNVEIIEVQATQNFTLNTSTTAGVTDLNVTKATGTAGLTASDAQNISVAGGAGTITIDGGKNVVVNDATANTDITIGGTTVNAGTITVTDTKLGTGVITIDGGTDVTVTASGVTGTGTIDIGQGGAATGLASGAVVVSSTGAAYDPASDATLSNINVNGGKTISVTQVATSDASKAASDKSAQTITQGNITITAAATTTDVTVKQTAAQSVKNAVDSTGGVTETVSVKFGKLGAGETLIINGLTLTAVEDMTAEQVAAAFANLAADAAIPSDATLNAADGDTQSSAAAAKATYSGSIDGWTSGAATGDTVVFTFATANAAPGGAALAIDGASTQTATTTLTTLTTGKAHDATPVGGVAAIVAGDVDITGGAALATVTVDGYGVEGNDQIQGGTNAALATVNLSNGGDFDIASAATTLALNLTNVDGTVDVKAGTTTLNATVNGTGTAILASATATTVKASGAGNVSSGGVALAAATSINTVDLTGTAAFTLDGATTTYTGGAGVDTVVLAAGAALSKAIDLGAGDDTLVLAATTASSTATLSGGDGVDTLSMTGARADALDAAVQTFYTNFERLLINDNAAVTVDLANLGFTNYVTNSGSSGQLTLNNLANNGTVVQTAAATSGVTVAIKDAATGTADVLNYVLSSAAGIAAGKLTANNVETVKLTVTDTNTTAHEDSLTLAGDKVTTLTIGGNASLDLAIDSTSVKLATIDAGAMTGALEVEAAGYVAMTITGGSGNDTLAASFGATAKADVINGGAGNDTLVAGTNGAKLTGGAGNDIFVLADQAGDGTGGTKEANTYTTVEDFTAGDLLQLTYHFNDGVDKSGVATGFNKLEAVLNPATANFSNYVEAAMQQIAAIEQGGGEGEGQAVWFTFGGSTFVVVESNGDGSGTNVSGAFDNGEDLVIELAGVNGANLSFNSDFGTVGLI